MESVQLLQKSTNLNNSSSNTIFRQLIKDLVPLLVSPQHFPLIWVFVPPADRVMKNFNLNSNMSDYISIVCASVSEGCETKLADWMKIFR